MSSDFKTTSESAKHKRTARELENKRRRDALDEAEYGELSTEERLAEQYARQQELYEKNYMPLIEDLEKESTSREYVKDATETAAKLEGNALARVERGQSRSVGGLTNVQKLESARAVKSKAATAGTSMINRAKDAQRTRNESISNDMMNVSNAMATGSTADLATIAGQEAQRNAQYEAEKSAAGAQLWGTVGTVVGAVGGMFIGNPMLGAAVGGGIGTAVGGR